MSGAEIVSKPDFFASLVRGAQAGAALGPIGMGAGAAAALVADLCDATGVSRWLFGTTAADTQARVTQAVVVATGAADAAGQSRVLEADPAAVAKLREALAGIAAAQAEAHETAQLETLRATLGDVQSARNQTLALVEQKSLLAWGAPIVSICCLLGWGAISLLSLVLVVKYSPLPDGTVAILSLILGAASTMGGTVVNYWVGSSAGSARKSDQIERLSTAPTA